MLLILSATKCLCLVSGMPCARPARARFSSLLCEGMCRGGPSWSLGINIQLVGLIFPALRQREAALRRASIGPAL